MFQFFLVINSGGEALLDCLSIYCQFDVATLYLHLFVWEGVWHLGIVACYFQKGNLEVKLRIFVWGVLLNKNNESFICAGV